MADRIEFEGEGFRAWCYTAIPAEPGTGDWADIHVETPRGRFVATFYTLDGIRHGMDDALRDGRACPGRYFTDRSMVIVRTLDIPTIQEAVADLVRTGEVYHAFEPCRGAGEESESERRDRNTTSEPAMSNDAIRSTTAAEPVGPYPHARRVGNLVFLSGVGPRKRGSKDIPGAQLDAQGKLIGWDIEAEMRSCFDNIRTILSEAGSRWENIVDVTVFLTDMKRDWQTYNRVYGEFFPAGPNQPCRTTVEIKALPTGGNTPIHFEIKVIATV